MELKGKSYIISSTIDEVSLAAYVSAQCNSFFPDNDKITSRHFEDVLPIAIDRLGKCFSKIIVPYYRKNNKPFFNHLHGDHYSMFLYILSNTVYTNLIDGESLASKLFLLNKALFGIDAFYAVELPEVFLFIHPIGTILGKAKYGNFLVVYQGVTVGATTDLNYPDFSDSTILYSNASIIGACKAGENFILAANSTIINTDIYDDKIVLGNYPNNRIITNHKNLITKYFEI